MVVWLIGRFGRCFRASVSAAAQPSATSLSATGLHTLNATPTSLHIELETHSADATYQSRARTHASRACERGAAGLFCLSTQPAARSSNHSLPRWHNAAIAMSSSPTNDVRAGQHLPMCSVQHVVCTESCMLTYRRLPCLALPCLCLPCLCLPCLPWPLSLLFAARSRTQLQSMLHMHSSRSISRSD